MNPIALSVVALFVLAPLALAGPPSLEGGGPPERDAEARIERMAEELGLDADQEAAIREIAASAHTRGRELHEALRSQMEVLREARAATDDKAMRRGIQELDRLLDELHENREGTRDAIRSELTPAQEVSFLEHELRRQHRERQVIERVRDLRAGEAPR